MRYTVNGVKKEISGIYNNISFRGFDNIIDSSGITVRAYDDNEKISLYIKEPVKENIIFAPEN